MQYVAVVTVVVAVVVLSLESHQLIGLLFVAVHSQKMPPLVTQERSFWTKLNLRFNRILFFLSGWELELATLKATFRCATF